MGKLQEDWNAMTYAAYYGHDHLIPYLHKLGVDPSHLDSVRFMDFIFMSQNSLLKIG